MEGATLGPAIELAINMRKCDAPGSGGGSRRTGGVVNGGDDDALIATNTCCSTIGWWLLSKLDEQGIGRARLIHLALLPENALKSDWPEFSTIAA